jgi:hypothetical protein
MKKRNWPTAYRACTESKAKECWLARGGLENLMKAGLAGWLWCYTQFCIRVFFSFGLSICFDNELSSSVCR